MRSTLIAPLAVLVLFTLISYWATSRFVLRQA